MRRRRLRIGRAFRAYCATIHAQMKG